MTGMKGDGTGDTEVFGVGLADAVAVTGRVRVACAAIISAAAWTVSVTCIAAVSRATAVPVTFACSS
jgi:hypothetical protein